MVRMVSLPAPSAAYGMLMGSATSGVREVFGKRWTGSGLFVMRVRGARRLGERAGRSWSGCGRRAGGVTGGRSRRTEKRERGTLSRGAARCL